MKRKKVKIIKAIFIILIALIMLLMLCAFQGKNVSYADSGFSASYNNDSKEGGMIIFAIIFYFLPEEYRMPAMIVSLFATIGIVLYLYRTRIRIMKSENKKVEKELKELLPNFNNKKFFMDGFDKYCKIQNAFMNEDLESVKDLMSAELFEKNKLELEGLKENGEQKIYRKIKLKKCYLKDIIKQESEIIICTNYVIDEFTYIVNRENKKYKRGTKTMKLRDTYEMNFRLDGDEQWILIYKEKVHEVWV